MFTIKNFAKLYLLLLFIALNSCVTYVFRDIIPRGEYDTNRIKFNGFYFNGDNSVLNDTTINSYKNRDKNFMPFIFFYNNGEVISGNLYSNFKEDLDNHIPFNSINFWGLCNVQIHSKSNVYLEKLKILSHDSIKKWVNSPIPWGKFGIEKDTLFLNCFDVESADIFMPVVMNIKYKFLIVNDTTLFYFSYQHTRFHNKEIYIVSPEFINQHITTKSEIFKKYSYHLFATKYIPNNFTSFFNTNKSYLRYCERMKRKELKRNKK